MWGQAARAVWNEPTTCTARWRSRSSSVDLGEARPPHDPGVVDQHVDASEALDGAVDERLRARGGGHVVGVGDGPAAGGDDLGDDRVRRRGVGALAPDRAAEVVDHDRRAALGQQVRVGAADAAPGAGDDGDAPVEAELAQAGTGASKPRRSPRVPPTMALRSSSGTPAISVVSSSWLPRNVPSAWG